MTSPERGATAGQTRFARRGVARLAYETVGTGDYAVLLLHDLLASRASLAAWRAALTAAGARVIVPDLRGHGASAAIPGVRYTVAELVLDALAVLDAEAVASVAVLGVGFGGAIALDLARVAPDRVRRLVLIDPLLPGVLRDDPDPAVAARFAAAREEAAAVADLANRGAVDRAFDRYFGGRHGAAWRSAYTPPQLGAMRRHSAAFGSLLLAAYAYQPTLTRLPETMLLRGPAPDELSAMVEERLAATGARRLASPADQEIPAAAIAFLIGAEREGRGGP